MTVGDLTLAVYEEGDGPAVVMVHGFPELDYSWRHQLPALARAGFHGIAYDLRGYGESHKPESIAVYGLEHLTADLVGLLDALGLVSAVLVGHDWGSIVVWTTVVTRPERSMRWSASTFPTGAGAVASPTPNSSRSDCQRGSPTCCSSRSRAGPRGASPRTRRAGCTVSSGGSPRTPTSCPRRISPCTGTLSSREGSINYYRNIDANWEATAHLAHRPIEVPTLVIAADSDPVLPPSLTEGMERWVPDLRVEIVQDCGHWTQQEQPGRVNELLVGFLRGLFGEV